MDRRTRRVQHTEADLSSAQILSFGAGGAGRSHGQEEVEQGQRWRLMEGQPDYRRNVDDICGGRDKQEFFNVPAGQLVFGKVVLFFHHLWAYQQ